MTEILLDEAKPRRRQTASGKLVARESEGHRAWLDGQPLTARCAACDWSFSGPALEARERGEQHRQETHPELRKGRLSDARKKEEKQRKAELKRQVEAANRNRDEAVRRRDTAKRVSRRSETVKTWKAWTLAEATAALHAFFREHGRLPQYHEMKPKNGLPSATRVTGLCGSFADFVEQAGYERPTRGRTAQPKPGPAATPARAQTPAGELAGIPVVPDPGVPRGEVRIEFRPSPTRELIVALRRLADVLERTEATLPG